MEMKVEAKKTLIGQGVKNAACERLLDQRMGELKMKSKKLNECLNCFHVAIPKLRDQKERPPFIPGAVLEAKTKKAEQVVQKQIKLEKDLEDENGGVCVCP
ncbi:Nucleolar GTP-binding protein 1 [Abeliophyllum distichum]|uniref:Nucleolar GTP-binding protein 1 n=1 Tax=Abeliophyllum distichum TaxID=126358 RepID=A0ABD1QXS5_9LAMI